MSSAAAAPLREPAVIPIPRSVTREPGEFRVDARTDIVVAAGDAEARRAATRLAELIRQTHGITLAVRAGAARDGAINLDRSGDRTLGAEAYRIDVRPARATVSANTSTGLFYGAITLWQLLDATESKTATLPAIRIADAPRFAWRGAMLDSARYFQSPGFVRQFIDWMALHKLNVLHWHLTDDQAWRLEIRKYPLLTEVGAWRVPAGPAAQADIDPATGKPRQTGGFYSQETVKAIVAYAAERGVTIVPEIEMPGHASAAIAAYPALAATANPPRVTPADWGIYPNVYNLDDATFKFLEDVLTETMALFPGKYIHVGGDEVEKTQWQQWPAAQQRVRELGIKDPAAIQVWFTQRIARFLQSRGRRLVGWDEILQPGLPPAAVVMSWRGIDGAVAAAKQGHDTILSPWPTLYFDNRQSAAKEEPPGRGRVISLETVYRFEPLPPALTADEQRHVLGLQGNIWTEHIRTEARAGMMTFPRVAAVAELGWSAPERRNWPDFARRMAVQMGRYDALQVPHSDSAFAVEAVTTYSPDRGAATVALSTQAGIGEIRYTLDGSEPVAASPLYREPVAVDLRAGPRELRAASFADGVRIAKARSTALDPRLALRRFSHELKLCSENIDLALEDDAPLQGSRRVFLFDIQNPCWMFKDVPLDAVEGVTAAVGQVPFNFQIGEDVKKIVFAKPATPEGELEVHLDTCSGATIARLPLAPAAASQAVTVLPRGAMAPQGGRHDLCLQFAQTFAHPETDPVWVLDWIQFNERAAPAAAKQKQ